MNLMDVYNNKYIMDVFVGFFSFDNLVELIRGEGMSLLKVIVGIVVVFGGVIEELLGKGILIVCVVDGLSGICMDLGFYVFSLFNGIFLVFIFDVKLVEDFY